MAQVFHPATNPIARFTIFGLFFILIVVALLMREIYRSQYVTGAYTALDQPIPFSHKWHAGDLGIDCRYCHVSAEEGSFAGIPPTETCMICHQKILADAPMLLPVRDSFQTGRPLRWNRVHNLADFCYFDHSIHLAKGIACVTCHGPVDRMPLMWKTQTLYMKWCIDCHRHPERYVRPRDHVFQTDWEPPEDQDTMGRRLVRLYGIRNPLSCSVCHR